MNTEKLLSVVKDLLIDEEDFSLQNKINALHEAISQNNAEQIEELKGDLIESLESGRVRNFTPSENAIVRKVEAEKYFGRTAILEVNDFFNNNIFKLQENFVEYRSERKQVVARLKQLESCLEATNIKPHYQTDMYEVGIILPNNFLTLDKTSEALTKWNKFLNKVADVKGVDKKIEVSLVSQGSIELYVLAALPLAKTINAFLGELVKMYEKVYFIREKEEELKILKNKKIQEELKTEREQIENKFVEDATAEMLRGVKFPNKEDGNDTKESVKGHVKTILKLHKDGVMLEIKAPEIEEIDDSLEGSEKEKKEKEIEKSLKEQLGFHEINESILKIDPEESRHYLQDSNEEPS